MWGTDITCVPIWRGFMYLMAVMDWFMRCMLAWELSNSMDTTFYASALKRALSRSRPGIFNTDQGSQFTSDPFMATLLRHGIRISMDGRGRALDNPFIDRRWRSVKCEDIYLRGYVDDPSLRARLTRYFRFSNHERSHSSLNDQTPAHVYWQ